MDFTLTEFEGELLDLGRTYAEREIAQAAARAWHEERCPTELLRGLGRLGLLGTLVPEKWGGIGSTTVGYVALRGIGWKGLDTRDLFFDDGWVPDNQVVGEPGGGLGQFLSALEVGRISVAALSLGTAAGAMRLALAYAKQHEAFGTAISNFQAIQFKLADMATEIEAARWLTYHAAALRDAGKPFKKEATCPASTCSWRPPPRRTSLAPRSPLTAATRCCDARSDDDRRRWSCSTSPGRWTGTRIGRRTRTQ